MTGKQIVWHLLNGIDKNPLCQNQNCNKTVKWRRNQYSKYCSTYCMNTCTEKQQAVKATLLERYGVETTFASEAIIKKSKETKKRLYGDENYSNKEKARQTNLAKYGAPTPFESEIVRSQIKEILLQKYGSSSVLELPEFREKIKATNLERYGCENPQQSEEIRNKTAKTNEERYGSGTTFKSPEIKKKIRKTMIERHGVETPFQSETIRRKARKTVQEKYNIDHVSQIHISPDSLKILNDVEKFKNYISEKSAKEIANELGVNLTTIYDRIHKYGLDSYVRKTSYLETEMADFLKNNGINFETNTRKVIAPYELNFYIQEHNIAIEMNGDYWHSHERLNNSKYHYEKWQRCQEQGIRLIQILESDWNQNQEKFKSLIFSLTKRKPKGDPARKCKIQQIDAKTARMFLDQYHLQGFVTGTTHWGAYNSDNNLVGVMTFGWTRGSKQSRRFELKRWVTDNYSHAGLFSKTFEAARRKLNFDEVVSFSMNDWFTGDVYAKCGFVKGKILPPSYSYLYNNKKTHLSNFTKKNISKKFPEVYDDSLTEREMMERLGIYRVYDSGKTEWIWKQHKNKK